MTLHFFAPWAVHALVLALHRLLPARHVRGYVKSPDGEPLPYRLNGLWVLLVTVGLWAALCWSGWLPWSYLWDHRWEGFLGAATLGLMFTAAIVFSAPPRGAGLGAEIFLGRRANPQKAGVDAKMYLYLAGAVLLELHLLSALAHHALLYPGAISPGLVLYTAMFSFFVVEYLFFEQVHLYTWDFVAEGVGFKLGWGCLAFYPYFYAVGAWSEAGKPDPGTPWPALLASALVFLAGWGLSRGANLQKFWFKTRPHERYLGLLAPEVLTDGQRQVLVNGFWGVSRHVNYLGEILMAIGLTLSLGRPLEVLPWLYPLYYVLLLVPRQWDDDRRCAAKYGPLWEEYRRRVPYRIVPGLY